MVRLAQQTDIETWLKIAKEVEHLFGPMADSREFQEGIRDCIQDGDAYCMENEGHNVVGIIAVNRKENGIAWLAVGEKYRGNQYGEKLLDEAIEELEVNGDIYVQTFSATTEEGKKARALYERKGFRELKKAGKNPAGVDTVIMVREKKQG